MIRLVRAAATSLLVVCSLVGCRPQQPVESGESLYREGAYADAIGRFEDAELAYSDGRLGPEHELRYLAFRGLAHYRLYKASGDKGERRRARPLVRRALERWGTVPDARAEKWLDDAAVKELEEAGRDIALGPPGENGPPDEPAR